MKRAPERQFDNTNPVRVRVRVTAQTVDVHDKDERVSLAPLTGEAAMKALLSTPSQSSDQS